MLLALGEGRDGDRLPSQGTDMNEEDIPDLDRVQKLIVSLSLFQIAQCLK